MKLTANVKQAGPPRVRRDTLMKPDSLYYSLQSNSDASRATEGARHEDEVMPSIFRGLHRSIAVKTHEAY